MSKRKIPPTKIDKHNLGAHDKGAFYERTEWNDLEKAFADHWEEANKRNRVVNHGCGLLQDLFFRDHYSCEHYVEPLERYVAATAIQWLGTNCGFAFLQGVLRAVGYKVVEIDPEKWLKQYRHSRVPPISKDPQPNPYARKLK